MSSREPLWYCHECHAEMRPLMVPDPHCASCNGTFVEKIESETDDPRAFQTSGPAPGGGGLGFDQFLINLGSMFGTPSPPASSSQNGSRQNGGTRGPESTGGGFRFEFSQGGPGRGMRTYVLGGPPTLGGTRGSTGEENPSIAGPLMAQYILSMLASHRRREAGEDPFGGLAALFGEGPESGQWDDYAFTQEAMDRIITRIMETSDAGRPVPATKEVMENLDRDVLVEGSPMLERECAVCKEQFAIKGEDPNEEPDQVVVTLACKHPFHESCITPWLNTSGTCPVCRYQLVPQPTHPAPTPGPGPSGGSNNSGSPGQPSRSPPGGNSGSSNGGAASGFLSSLFGSMAQGRQGGNSSSGARPSRAGDHDEQDDLPGGWVD